VRCAGACERERHRPGQPAEAAGLRFEQGGVEARDDDERRACRLGCAGERCDRRVRAEKENPPEVRAQDEREREQGDVVHLTGCTGEQSKRACSAAPEPRKRKQPAADEVAPEVLLAVAQQNGTVKPLEGEQISLALKDGKLTLNGSATVVTADILATNGVIHVIDTVIVPPSLSA
jgi:hypothetical protein